MTTRIVEGKKPYTGGTAIEIDENKVISLRLRDENNLIIYDAGDNEIYVDLQLPDGIRPLDAFPVGVTTGRVLVADDWDKTGTIICAKTTSGDNIKVLYADDGTLWIDNGTGTFKQIYFKADVDAIIATLTAYINAELAKKQNGVVSATAPESPAQGDLWYDTTSNSMKVYDGTAWQSVGGGSDIVYATQAEYNALLPGAASDGKHYFIYSTSGGGGWQPGANTVAYYPLTADTNDQLNTYNLTNSNITFGELGGVTCANFNGSSSKANGSFYAYGTGDLTASVWGYPTSNNQGVWWAIYVNTLVMNSKNGYVEGTSAPTPLNQWTNIVFTITGGKLKIYSNGTLYLDTSYSNSLSGDLSLGASNNNYYISGGVSNLIFENVAWTAQEVSDYFDLTKGDYGIS